MNKKKILIVDDEPEFIEAVKLRLEQSGYETLSALDGNEGLEMVEKHKPDCILLDITMRGKDGYTMIQELKERQGIHHTPVIVVTGKPHMEPLFKLEGIKDYVLKPFDDEDLLSRIKKVLEGK